MAQPEAKITAAIRLALSGKATLFRNHVGLITDSDGQAHRFGLHIGSPDLVGWKSVIITPEMVGQRIAIFTGIEVKTPRGRVTEPQRNFLSRLEGDGGIAGVARSAEDAEALITR